MRDNHPPTVAGPFRGRDKSFIQAVMIDAAPRLRDAVAGGRT